MMQAFLIFFFAVVGACFGSFGNVVIDRLPAGASLGGRSRCDHCKKILRIWELLPIVSWCMLRGRCARCHKPIPSQFTIVECLCAVLFVAALMSAAFDVVTAIPIALALWAMVCITHIDIQTRTIPDALTLVIALCGVFLRIHDQTFPVLAIVISGGFFGLQWLVSRGSWIGSGDVLLGAALGILLGTWPLALLMLWLAYISALVFVGVQVLIHKKLDLKAQLSFGPFITLGGLTALLCGEDIIRFLF